MNYRTLIVLVLIILVVTACSTGSEDELTANIWLLTDLGGTAPLPDTSVTAEFDEEGRVSGNAGCNNYSTSYTVDGDQISFGEVVGSTMMMCPDPVMAQEALYLEALDNTTTYEIVDDELNLMDANGDKLARFEAISQGLEGTNWDVIAYNNGKEAVVSVVIGSEITANFGEDNQLTGKAGCNDYTASYETEDDSITIVVGALTRKYCESPEGVMEQEQQYLAALETAATYKIEGMTMQMRTADGAMAANFSRTVSP